MCTAHVTPMLAALPICMTPVNAQALNGLSRPTGVSLQQNKHLWAPLTYRLFVCHLLSVQHSVASLSLALHLLPTSLHLLPSLSPLWDASRSPHNHCQYQQHTGCRVTANGGVRSDPGWPRLGPEFPASPKPQPDTVLRLGLDGDPRQLRKTQPVRLGL